MPARRCDCRCRRASVRRIDDGEAQHGGTPCAAPGLPVGALLELGHAHLLPRARAARPGRSWRQRPGMSRWRSRGTRDPAAMPPSSAPSPQRRTGAGRPHRRPYRDHAGATRGEAALVMQEVVRPGEQSTSRTAGTVAGVPSWRGVRSGPECIPGSPMCGPRRAAHRAQPGRAPSRTRWCAGTTSSAHVT